LTKAFNEANVLAKWEKTAWARKQAIKTKRASLNDFDRFKVMLGKKERSRVVWQELKKLVKEDRKATSAKQALRKKKKKVVVKPAGTAAAEKK